MSKPLSDHVQRFSPDVLVVSVVWYLFIYFLLLIQINITVLNIPLFFSQYDLRVRKYYLTPGLVSHIKLNLPQHEYRF
jgi:hypothetical protein